MEADNHGQRDMIKAAERERKNAMRAVAWLRKRRERSLQANKQMRDAADNALRTLMTPERRNARIDKAEREVQAAARFQCKMLREYKSFAGPRGVCVAKSRHRFISIIVEISLDLPITFQYLSKYEQVRRFGGLGRTRPGQSPRRVSPARRG